MAIDVSKAVGEIFDTLASWAEASEIEDQILAQLESETTYSEKTWHEISEASVVVWNSGPADDLMGWFGEDVVKTVLAGETPKDGRSLFRACNKEADVDDTLTYVGSVETPHPADVYIKPWHVSWGRDPIPA